MSPASLPNLRSSLPVIVALSLLWLASPLWGQTVSLSDAEQARIRVLIEENPAAEVCYESLLGRAREATTLQPHPVQRFVLEGRAPGDPERLQSKAALDDMRAIEALAFAFAVTGEREYLAKTREFVTAWAELYHSEGHPGNDSGIVPLLAAYDLTRSHFDDDEREDVDKWLRDVADQVSGSDKKLSALARCQRAQLLTFIGAVLHDQGLISEARQAFGEALDGQFAAELSEAPATNRLSACAALVDAARVFLRKGVRLYEAPLGADVSLHNLLDQCAAEKDAWTKDSFLARQAETLFERARLLDPSWKNLANDLSRDPGNEYPSWEHVLAEIQQKPPK